MANKRKSQELSWLWSDVGKCLHGPIKADKKEQKNVLKNIIITNHFADTSFQSITIQRHSVFGVLTYLWGIFLMMENI